MSKRPPFDPMRYANYLKKTGDFAAINDTLHRWTGSHWQSMSIQEAERPALSWLVSNSGGAIVGKDQAKKAVETALLVVPELTKKATDDLLIPLQNGYLRYEAGGFALTPPDKELGIDYLIKCEYDPLAPTPKRFKTFIEQILPDAAVKGRVQEYLGYTLMSDARFQRGQIWLGNGANGKGVLANIIQEFHANVATLNLAELSGFNLSHLLGSSLIYVDEIPTSKIDDATLKKLLAGETSAIRMHYRPTVSARVLAKWLILSNTPPTVADQSEGFWRRFDIVPFEVTIPESERDPLLAKKIIDSEMSGVLNWLLTGLERLLKRGRFDPTKPAAIAAYDSYARTRADSVRGWVEDADIGLSTVAATHKDSVYSTYSCWCKRNGLQAQAAPRFWPALAAALPGLIADARFTDEDKRRVRGCNVLLTGQ